MNPLKVVIYLVFLFSIVISDPVELERSIRGKGSLSKNNEPDVDTSKYNPFFLRKLQSDAVTEVSVKELKPKGDRELIPVSDVDKHLSPIPERIKLSEKDSEKIESISKFIKEYKTIPERNDKDDFDSRPDDRNPDEMSGTKKPVETESPKETTKRTDAQNIAIADSEESRQEAIASVNGHSTISLPKEYIKPAEVYIPDRQRLTLSDESQMKSESDNIESKSSSLKMIDHNLTPTKSLSHEEINEKLSPIPDRVELSSEDRIKIAAMKKHISEFKTIPESTKRDDFEKFPVDDLTTRVEEEPQIDQMEEIKKRKQKRESEIEKTRNKPPEISLKKLSKRGIHLKISYIPHYLSHYTCNLYNAAHHVILNESPQHARSFVLPYKDGVVSIQCSMLVDKYEMRTNELALTPITKTSSSRTVFGVILFIIIVGCCYAIYVYIHNHSRVDTDYDAQQGLLHERDYSRRSNDGKRRLFGYEEGGTSLSFIDDLVNMSRRKKPTYVGLASYKVCTFCGYKNSRNSVVCQNCNGALLS